MRELKTGLSNPKNRKMWERTLRVAKKKFPHPIRDANVLGLSEIRWAHYYGFSAVTEYREWRRNTRARQLREIEKLHRLCQCIKIFSIDSDT